MNLTGGFVLFTVIWFMVFFVVLPIRFRSQEDEGEIVPGTPVSAPANADIGRKARITTAIAFVIWSVCAWVLLTGMFTLRDIDWFGRLGPEQDAAGQGN